VITDNKKGGADIFLFRKIQPPMGLWIRRSD